MSLALIADPAKALLFYFQAMCYSFNLTNVPPDGRAGPDTQRLVRYVQGFRGSPQTGVFAPFVLVGLQPALEAGRAASGRPVRLIPMNLWRRAGDAVNAAAQRAAPGSPLLQYRALDG